MKLIVPRYRLDSSVQEQRKHVYQGETLKILVLQEEKDPLISIHRYQHIQCQLDIEPTILATTQSGATATVSTLDQHSLLILFPIHFPTHLQNESHTISVTLSTPAADPSSSLTLQTNPFILSLPLTLSHITCNHTDNAHLLCITATNNTDRCISMQTLQVHLHQTRARNLLIDLGERLFSRIKTLERQEASVLPHELKPGHSLSLVVELAEKLGQPYLENVDSLSLLSTPFSLGWCFTDDENQEICITNGLVEWTYGFNARVLVGLEYVGGRIPVHQSVEIGLRVMNRYNEDRKMSVEIAKESGDGGLICQEKVLELGVVKTGESVLVGLHVIALKTGLSALGRILVNVSEGPDQHKMHLYSDHGFQLYAE